MSVVFYISGHGFGHAVRQFAIVNELARRAPDLPIHIVTAVSRPLAERSLPPGVPVRPAVLDTGAVQRGSLDVDIEATLREAATFHGDLDRKADEEARALEACGARFAVADIPPLAFVAAARAGIPAVGVANFTWDWIYEGYEEAARLAPGLVEQLRQAYALGLEAWRMPFAGGFEGFRVVRDLPLVARKARHERAAVRETLGLPQDVPLALVSLGGFGARGIDVPAAGADLRGVAEVVVTSYDAVPESPGVQRVDEAHLYASGFRYEDLVAAVDVVVSKPGYGIVSDCAANGTRLLYTSRGRFREYEVLVAGMRSCVASAFIDPVALRAGRWREPMIALLKLSAVAPPRSDGAAVAAEWILGGLSPT
ncbi:MAG TPA: hypothetical protein VIL35_11655 [Vicinamibacterales bacterium]